jgi:hypothetical protein
MKKMKKGAGFIAIFLVIALLAFSLSLTAAVTYLSIGESQSGMALARGAEVLALTEGCAEDALLLSVRDANYNGGTYNYLGGICAVDVIKNGTLWTMDVSGTKNNFNRVARIIFGYVPGPPGVITLQSWLEQ